MFDVVSRTLNYFNPLHPPSPRRLFVCLFFCFFFFVVVFFNVPRAVLRAVLLVAVLLCSYVGYCHFGQRLFLVSSPSGAPGRLCLVFVAFRGISFVFWIQYPTLSRR